MRDCCRDIQSWHDALGADLPAPADNDACAQCPLTELQSRHLQIAVVERVYGITLAGMSVDEQNDVLRQWIEKGHAALFRALTLGKPVCEAIASVQDRYLQNVRVDPPTISYRMSRRARALLSRI